MLTRKSSILLLIGALFSLPLTVAAQGKGVTSTAAGKGGVVSVDTLVTRYQPLAGTWSPNNANPKSNATSLVNGLRSGDQISLYGPMLELPLPTTPPPTTTPPPPPPSCKMPPCPTISSTTTRSTSTTTTTTTPTQPKMDTITFASPIGGTGYGNVDIALALAEADVKNKLPNMASATPEQLKAALLGGEVRTAPGASTKVTFTGVLALRAKGDGWGDIAKTLGFDLK